MVLPADFSLDPCYGGCKTRTFDVSKHTESRFLAGLSIPIVPSEPICLKSMNNCRLRLAGRAPGESWKHAGGLCVLVAFTQRHFGLIGSNLYIKTYKGGRETHAAGHPLGSYRGSSHLRNSGKVDRYLYLLKYKKLGA